MRLWLFVSVALQLTCSAQQTSFDNSQVVMFLRPNTFDNSIVVCVAAAISKNVLVTSAECTATSLSKNKLSNDQILLGTTNPAADIQIAGNSAGNFNRIRGSNFFNPENIIIHENYNPLTKADNIALLFVSNSSVKLSKISTQSLETNSSVIAAGAGQLLITKQNFTPMLNSSSVAVYPEATCKKILSSFNSSDNRQICVGNQESICGLDGMVFLPSTGASLLYAIGSFTGTLEQPQSNDCSSKDAATFFTGVGFYKDWIQANSGIQSAKFMSTATVKLPTFVFPSEIAVNTTVASGNSTETPVETLAETVKSSHAPASLLYITLLHLSAILVASFFTFA